MLLAPKRPEIDHRTIKLIVGIIALSLALLTRLLAGHSISSISASYWEQGSSQTVFIGYLFATAVLLLGYNGLSAMEMVLSKIAAGAALGVALYPCGCDGHKELVRGVHYASAATMFLVLAYFCYCFSRRAQAKGHREASRRVVVYLLCGLAIVGAVGVMALDALVLHGAWRRAWPPFVFAGEALALSAFGVSWLTASRTLPLLTRPSERFAPWRENNPA